MCLVSISRSGAGLALLNPNACNDAPARGATALALLPLLVIAVTGGMYAVAMSIAVLDLFRERLQFRDSVESRRLCRPELRCLPSARLSRAAADRPTVYSLCVLSTVKAAYARGWMATVMRSTDSPSCIGDGGSLPLVLGFITESCATLVLVYPCCRCSSYSGA